MLRHKIKYLIIMNNIKHLCQSSIVSLDTMNAPLFTLSGGKSLHTFYHEIFEQHASIAWCDLACITCRCFNSFALNVTASSRLICMSQLQLDSACLLACQNFLLFAMHVAASFGLHYMSLLQLACITCHSFSLLACFTCRSCSLLA